MSYIMYESLVKLRMVAMKISQIFRNFRYKCWSSSYSSLGKYHGKVVGNSYFDTRNIDWALIIQRIVC